MAHNKNPNFETASDDWNQGPISGSMFNAENKQEPIPADTPKPYQGDDPYGEPYDRSWPGVSGPIARPSDYNWYDGTPEQRFSAILNSWIIINDALDTGLEGEGGFYGVTDDQIMALAWGANDTEALDAGRAVMEARSPEALAFYEEMIGEGKAFPNPRIEGSGWPRLNGNAIGMSLRTSVTEEDIKSGVDGFGKLMIDRIREIEEKDIGKWDRWFSEPSSLLMFEAGYNGGNLGGLKAEQAHHRKQMRREIATTVTIIGLTGGAGAFWAKVPMWGKKVQQILSKGGIGSKVWRATHDARTVGFAFGVSAYYASQVLGVLDNSFEKELELTVEAVEAGQMTEEEANAIIAGLATTTEDEMPEFVTELDWYEAPPDAIEDALQTGTPDSQVRAQNSTVSERITVARETGSQMPQSTRMPFEATSVARDRGGYTVAAEDGGYALDSKEGAIVASGEGRIAVQAAQADTRERMEQYKQGRRDSMVGGMDPFTRIDPTLSPTPYEIYRNEPGRVAGLLPGLEGKGRLPSYFEEDYQDILAGWSSDRIEWFQQQVIEAGMLDPEDSRYKFGQRDVLTTTAFHNLLVDANWNGNLWEDQLRGNVEAHQRWLVDNPDDEVKYPPFVTPAYLAPDYASLAQQTKNTFNAKLGRRASQSELSLFTDHLRSGTRDEWDAQTQVKRQDHAANARAFESDEPESGGTVQGVDSISRFNEFFDEKFQGELAHRDRVDMVQRKQGGLFASLNRIAGNI